MALENETTVPLFSDHPEDESKTSDDGEGVELLTHEQTLFIMRILMFGVTPGISVLGIIGNIFSIIILLKHGLNKCSNILLICLAVTDATFLFAFSSVPKFLYEVVGREYAFEYSQDTSFALFILYNILNIFDYAMGYISLSMPMLITFERLIAVFLPFKFNLIITPFRTWCAVACVYVFWYVVVIYMSFWFTFFYGYSDEHNTTVGLMRRSALYHDTFHTVEAFQEVINYISVKIPPLVTFVGCIFISVKVKMASSQRKKMTQSSAKEASSNRTTKMLLAVCVVYMFTCALLTLPTYIPQYMYYSLISDVPSNLGRIMYQVMNTVVCVNSSLNFVVYVGMNKNFRDTYKSLFVSCFKKETK